jgi:AcrR family transcriptional regulator
MSMPSGSSTVARRVPQQDRSSKRVSSFLDAAETLIAGSSYEATTMTDIAQRSGASIGCVYQYFPDKESVARALHSWYGDQMEEQLAPIIEQAGDLSAEELAHRLVTMMVSFVDAHPAFLRLLEAPIRFARSPEARYRLRNRIAEAFRAKNVGLSKDEAWMTANVTLQILKSLGALYAPAGSQEKLRVTREFQVVLSGYLTVRL